jgi:biopolymer transport protein ExbD
MAHIESGGGKGRRTSLELNIVPFIDLMSVLITFLLITAVWTQVSMMQIGSSIYGKKTDNQTPTLPQEASVVLKLDIKPSGYILTLGKQVMSLPRLGEDYDEAGLLAQLQRAKQMYPNKQDSVVTMNDELPYERLIRGMDGLLKAGFPQISVATGGPP